MPCLCQVFCGNLSYEKVLPCFIVSVLRVLGVWGSQDLKRSCTPLASKFRRRFEVGEVSSKHTCFLSVLEPDFSQLFLSGFHPSPLGFQSFGISLCNRSQVPEAFSMISL